MTWPTHPGDRDHNSKTSAGGNVTAGKVTKADGSGAVEWGNVEADEVTYDNATSGLAATTAQAAIDELADGIDRDAYNLGASLSGAVTVDRDNGTWQYGTLTGNVTLTFSAVDSGKDIGFTLELTQDGTGGRTITWPGSVTWLGGSEPTHDTTADTTTLWTFLSRDGGTTWIGGQLGGSSVGALDDLSDVTITSPAADEVLRYNGSAWVNDDRIWRPLMDGAGNVITDSGTGEAVMALSS